MAGRPSIVAHRGASADAPENTRAAFLLAMEQGADGVELDVHLTADGRLCVIHDHVLDRTTTGTGLVGSKTMAELAGLSAGAWFSSRHAGETVPELADVLPLFPAGAVVNVEIKNGPVWYDRIGSAVAERLSPWKHKLSLIVSSFDHKVLEEVHRREPDLCLGLLYEAVLYDPVGYLRRLPYPVGSLHVWHHLVTSELVHAAHAAGVKVLAYTADREEDVRRLVACGADGIITNAPGAVVRLLRAEV